MTSAVGDVRPDPSDATTLTSLRLRTVAEGEGVPHLASGALRAIRAHLGMDVAFISEFTGGERVFRHVDTAVPDCPVIVGGADPLEESYCQRVVDGRLPEVIPDASAEPAAAELPVTAALPVGAHLSVPINLSDGRVYGTLCCFSAAPDHSLNERDVAMMRVFADLVAAQIDHDLAEVRVHERTAARLEAAIAGDGLSMVFQPIVDISTRRPVGFEALARFDGAPRRGPDVWFAEAASAGLGVELELAAVRLALEALAELPAHLYVAVNVSASTVISGRLDAVLARAPSNRVVLEITEHDSIDTYDDLQSSLRGLRRRGVRIAVDDAGAGYASFRHILRLRPDLIKLDMSLTRDIDADRARQALASALMAFARDTGSAIVAEGVETATELDTLRVLGAAAAQGYHLGRPQALSDVVSGEALSAL